MSVEIKAKGIVLENPSNVIPYPDGSKKQYAMVEVTGCDDFPAAIGKRVKGIRVVSNADATVTKSPVKAGEEVNLSIRVNIIDQSIVILVNSIKEEEDNNAILNHFVKITSDKTLFFDLDGTLIDTDYLNWISYKKAYKYVDNNNERPLDWYISTGYKKKELKELLEEFSIEERVDSSCFSIYHENIKEQFIGKKNEFYNKSLWLSKKIEENIEVLKRFSKTNKIILVSNCRKERGLETLKYHQLDKYFHRMFFAEDKILSKNKYENAIKSLGAFPEDIIAFEDDEKEIENAKKLGIKEFNIYVDTYTGDVVNGLLQNISGGKDLFYQNDDARIRIEIDKETLDYLLKDRADKIFIDERIYYFPKKEGELAQSSGKKYRISKGGLKEFFIESNQFLKQGVNAFYHKDYFSGGYWDIEGSIEHMIWSIKNDSGCKIGHQQYLSTAYKRLKIILQKDLPNIKEKVGVENLVVCIVPRAKEGFVYREDQLLFRKAVSDVVDKLKSDLSLTNGTKYLVRHTSTKTTHLKQNNEGSSPYVGITKDTCYISDNVIGKDILLVDDVYTKTANIDEDAIQALLDKGANSVHFYAIGKTYSSY